MKKLLLLVLLATYPGASPVAQEWPSKPIIVVMPYKPGGGGEGMVRLIMARVGQSLSQPVLIENRAGAGGTIGAFYVSKAKSDGYVLLASGLGSTVVAPAMEQVQFDPIKDFTHIALFGGPPPVLAVNIGMPIKSLAEYINNSKLSKVGIAYGSSGHGTHVHLVGELFKKLSGAYMLHVPYNGGGPASADLMAGHIQSGMITLASASQAVKAGKVRVLAIATKKRVPELPDAPTFSELGYGDLTGVTWFSLSGPAGLPRSITLKLNFLVRSALAQTDLRNKLMAEAIETGDLDPDAFTEFVKTEVARWTPIARSLPRLID